MKQKRRFFSLIWDLAAPLLLYMVISDMTLYACRMLGREITEAQILPVNAAGAALAAIPLGIWYREQRQRRHRSGVLQSGTVILLAAGACVFFNNLLMMLDIPSEGFVSDSKLVVFG